MSFTTTTGAAATARALSLRSVHLKIHPVPQTFAARREVLRVIERFGTVEMFRSLKYAHLAPVTNAFISIFETEDAAQDAINSSPIQYRLIHQQQQQQQQQPASSTSSTSTSSSPKPSQDEAPPPTQRQQDNQQQPQEFTLWISPTSHPHQTLISSSPIYGPFPSALPKLHPLVADLNLSIPQTSVPPRPKHNHSSSSSSSSSSNNKNNNNNCDDDDDQVKHNDPPRSRQQSQSQTQIRLNPGPARPGLCDWVTDSLATRRIGAATLAIGGVDAGAPFRLRKELREEREMNVPDVMRRGLWAVWEEGVREKERMGGSMGGGLGGEEPMGGEKS